MDIFSFNVWEFANVIICYPFNLVNLFVLKQSCFHHACTFQRGSNSQVEMELRKSIKQLLKEASTLSQ